MTSPPEQLASLRLGYLTSQYPATSHTFISREVAAIRANGIELDTFSIRPPSAAEMKDELIQRKASTTFTVLRQPVTSFLSSHIATFVSDPARYLRTFAVALGHRPPGIKGLGLSLAHFAEAVVLARELRRRAIRHLHNHFANSAATVGYLASRLLQIPWGFTMHGISETDYPAGLLLARKIEAAAFVACVSYFGRAQAMRLVEPRHWDKLHVVRCGLHLDRLPRRSDAAQDEIRIVCVGRLSPEKGQTGLLEAFSHLASDLHTLQLVFVGDGPDLESVRATAHRLGLEKRVTFAGRLGEHDTLDTIARSDILVVPSFMEGLPIVLMEAMAVGTVAIASRVAGIPELVRDNETGLLFTPSDWVELAQCIRNAAGDRELRKRLADGARARVADEFDIRRSAEQLIRLFRIETSR